MSDTLELALCIPHDMQAHYREMAKRCRGVRVLDADHIEDVSSNAAIITTDPNQADHAVQRGHYVLVIRPFHLAPDIQTRMTDSKLAMPGHVARYRPATACIAESLRAGNLGDPGLLRIHRWKDSSDAQNAIDDLDVACWIFGSRPHHIYSVTSDGYRQTHLGFASGAMAILDWAQTQPDQPTYESMHLICASGAAYADDHRNTNLLIRHGRMEADVVCDGDVGIADLIQDFAHYVRTGEEKITWEETRLAIQVANEVDQSADQQRVLTTVVD